MDTFIHNSTAQHPLGLPGVKTCFRVSGGPYTNRLAVVFAPSANTIAITWADPPYSSFSSLQTIVSDSADSSFSACMDNSGNIHLAYIVDGNNHLASVTLTFSSGQWSAGTPITVFEADDNSCPTVYADGDNQVGILFTRLHNGSKYINYKESTDGGATWGTVSDPGITLTSGASEAYGKLIANSDYLYAFFTEDGMHLAYRRKLISGSSWDASTTLASGSGFGSHFSVAQNADGRIGIAYVHSGGLSFREYGGAVWSGQVAIDANACANPSVSYQGGIAYVLFSRQVGTGMNLLYYSRQHDSSFTSPEPLDSRKSFPDKLLVYDQSAGSLQDKTAEAISTDTADISHSNISGIMADSGDALFVGMDEPFHFLNFLLSTAGSGGEVNWLYFDGQTWKSFTPASGNWNLTTTNHALLLWSDYQSIPSDWQKKIIDGKSLYWIAAIVTTPFSTAPIGSQIMTVSNLNSFSQQV